MSENGVALLGQDVFTLDVSPQFEGYSKVEIIYSQDDNGEDISYSVGDSTGRTLTIREPMSLSEAQTRAAGLLNRIRGFRYQPYKASNALLEPIFEIGDAVSFGDTYSGLYKISRTYGSDFVGNIEAPADEEIDHEYPYEPSGDRVFKREIAQATAQISLNSSAIEAKVSKNVRTQIGQNESFGWRLESDSWTVQANDKNILTATKNGLSVYGNIAAYSGTIGTGDKVFSIGKATVGNVSYAAIVSGKTSLDDTNNDGIYLGTNGISLGKGVFKVTSAGAVTAKNLTISGGSINLGPYQENNQTKYNFTVTNGGAVTARNLQISGGSMNINNAFKVASDGAVTASSLSITGGSINIGNAFTVTNTGAATASNITVKGGSISVGGTAANPNFSVDTSGKMTAVSGSIGRGTYAFNIGKNVIDNQTYYSINSGKSRIGDGNSGIYLGTDGIELGNGNFKVDRNGSITAKSGYIGNGSSGFIIGASYIRNGRESLNESTHDGIYIGTNGISLGKKQFVVTSAGNLTANNATLTGTLSIGGKSITAADLQGGAQAAASGAGGWNTTKKTVDDNKSKWNKASTNADKALSNYDGLVSGSITATSLLATKFRAGSYYISGSYKTLSASTITINGTSQKIVTWA